MKFTILASRLQTTLNKAIKFVPTRTTIPILENFLFEVKGTNLIVSATDLNTYITITNDFLQVEEEGKIVIPAKRIYETIKALPPTQDIEFIENKEHKLTMKCGKGEYKITGDIATDYPIPPKCKFETELLFSAEHLKDLINVTTFAVSTDEVRPAMTGIYFCLQKSDPEDEHSELIIAGTDGHRLSRVVISNDDDKQFKQTAEVIIPVKSLDVIQKFLNESVKINISKNYIKFTFDNVVVYSQLIDEQYPNIDAVIPKNYTKRMEVDREDLIKSIRRVSIYSNETTHQVRFLITKNKLTVFAQDFTIGGEAKEFLECEYGFENIEIGFNSKYLLDVLTHLDTETTIISFDTAINAVTFEPTALDIGDERVIMIVMPVRLQEGR